MTGVTGFGCRCGARWTGRGRAHCAACHATFSTASAFDRHRRGGACLDPAAVGLVRAGAVWRWAGQNPRAPRKDAPEAAQRCWTTSG